MQSNLCVDGRTVACLCGEEAHSLVAVCMRRVACALIVVCGEGEWPIA
jgi:hypothetical protein